MHRRRRLTAGAVWRASPPPDSGSGAFPPGPDRRPVRRPAAPVTHRATGHRLGAGPVARSGSPGNRIALQDTQGCSVWVRFAGQPSCWCAGGSFQGQRITSSRPSPDDGGLPIQVARDGQYPSCRLRRCIHTGGSRHRIPLASSTARSSHGFSIAAPRTAWFIRSWA